ncbi:hypothetical protein NSK11_contig00136-0003 [Nocardia seriolae]|uniref:Uncharacterized protein n=1 Tax=Nocardia seriolae TaxID=37332 RepID=A0ABC9Z2N5_9NOCA|nr:hypothetical protein NSK11_contig00136-0003 [Nocardia seriolae]
MAAGFQLVIRPSSVLLRMASSEDSIKAASNASWLSMLVFPLDAGSEPGTASRSEGTTPARELLQTS